jgi:hypothetical protein
MICPVCKEESGIEPNWSMLVKTRGLNCNHCSHPLALEYEETFDDTTAIWLERDLSKKTDTNQ